MVDSAEQTIATSPLLETKLYIPKWRTGLIPRARLIEHLDRGAERKLTLVSAPAGCGKTTALAEWVHSVGARHAVPLQISWVSLDQSDNDPALFWAYFITALRTIRPGVGERALSLLHSPQPPPIEVSLGALLNEVSTTLRDPSTGPPMRHRGDSSRSSGHGFVVMLDDYHLIDAQPVHDGLPFFSTTCRLR